MRRVVKKKKRDRKAGLPEEWTAYLAGVYIVLEKKKKVGMCIVKKKKMTVALMVQWDTSFRG